MSDPIQPDGNSTEAEELDLAIEGVLEEAERDEDAAQRTVKEAEQRVLRAQAELENVRKRMRKEAQEERRYAFLPLVRDLLPAIDNLERAVESADASAGPPGLVEGVKMVASQIIDILAQHQCVPIQPLGEPFDPMKHEAVAQQPSDEFPAGTVMQVMQVGYMLNDRVVRPAHVVVSQGG